jgi:membrane protein required for beta-lactamase induction
MTWIVLLVQTLMMLQMLRMLLSNLAHLIQGIIILCVNIGSIDTCDKDRKKHDDARSASRMNTAVLH